MGCLLPELMQISLCFDPCQFRSVLLLLADFSLHKRVFCNNFIHPRIGWVNTLNSLYIHVNRVHSECGNSKSVRNLVILTKLEQKPNHEGGFLRSGSFEINFGGAELI